jgi:hypothetical protein
MREIRRSTIGSNESGARLRPARLTLMLGIVAAAGAAGASRANSEPAPSQPMPRQICWLLRKPRDVK